MTCVTRQKEAIQFSWQLLTEVYGLPKDRLYVTYFEGDSKNGLEADLEARQLWLDQGVPEDHVLPGNAKDNFWGEPLPYLHPTKTNYKQRWVLPAHVDRAGQNNKFIDNIYKTYNLHSEVHYDLIGGGRNAAHLVNNDDPPRRRDLEQRLYSIQPRRRRLSAAPTLKARRYWNGLRAYCLRSPAEDFQLRYRRILSDFRKDTRADWRSAILGQIWCRGRRWHRHRISCCCGPRQDTHVCVERWWCT